MKRKTRFTLRGAVVLFASLLVQTPGAAYDRNATCASTVVGHLDVLPLASKVFANTRNLRVWLPPNYGEASESTKKYPVLYMLDGQNLFDVCTAVGAVDEWRVDETMTNLIQRHLIEPVIVVGIDSVGGERERMHEYLPYRDIPVFPTMAEPAGKQFPEFLGNEVLPFIKAHYRVEAGPKHTAIGGSSYGAIAALYALLMRPDLFGQGILESPALQVGNGQLLRDTTCLSAGPEKMFLSMGTTEVPTQDILNRGLVKMLEALAKNLESAYLDHPDVLTAVQPGGIHNERSWSTQFSAAVQFLYQEHGR